MNAGTLMFAIGIVAAGPGMASDRSKDEAGVLAAERAICQAYENEDADWLASIWMQPSRSPTRVAK